MDFSVIKSLLETILNGSWMLFKTWWWLILPIIVYFPAKHFYRWWIHWDVWYKEDNEFEIVEIVPPSEIKKPFRAMEDFFTAAFWPLYDAPNWREMWCEGELENGPFWMTFEVASFGGDIHFYARIPKWFRKLFESILHAHYPDVEIIDAEDYTKNVPQDIPNKDYKVYGEDYALYRNDSYPITTYKFFEIKPEEIEADARLDTFSALMESMAKLNKGEQLWFQMTINPVLNSDTGWTDNGRAEADKLAKREVKGPDKTIAGEAYRLIAHNKMPFEQKEEEKGFLPPEMKLTPGERDTLSAVEEKIAKRGFRTYIRSFYITDKDSYFSPNGKIVRAYFSHFTSENLNSIAFINKTRPKIHYFFRKRRVYMRKRKMFKRYVKRLPPFFPNRMDGGMILNAEELTTIFHLPVKAALLPPGVPRTAAKKGVPPPAIPLE